MQHPRLKVVLYETAQVGGYQIEGAFPMFGNNNRGVDQIATAAVGADSKKVVRPPSDRNERHIRTTLTITDAVEHPEKYPSRGPWSVRKE